MVQPQPLKSAQLRSDKVCYHEFKAYGTYCNQDKLHNKLKKISQAKRKMIETFISELENLQKNPKQLRDEILKKLQDKRAATIGQHRPVWLDVEKIEQNLKYIKPE